MSLRSVIEDPQTLRYCLIAVVVLAVLSTVKKLGKVMGTVVVVLSVLIIIFVMNPDWAQRFWGVFDATDPWAE